MQKDKKKRLWKIAKELLKDPLQTTRELEKKTWISKSAIANYINNDLDTLGLKDPKIVLLTDKDFNCIVLWVEEIERRLKDKEELNKMRVTEISQVIKDNTARYTLFRWDATNLEWWSKLPAIIQIINPNEENNI